MSGGSGGQLAQSWSVAAQRPRCWPKCAKATSDTVAQRLALDASAGVEVLTHRVAGVQLAERLESSDAQVWTVEHFHLKVARVLRRDVLTGDLDDAEARQLVASLAAWQLHVARVAPLLVNAWELHHNVTVHDAL